MNSKKNLRYLLLVSALLVVCNISFGCASISATGSDMAWWEQSESKETKIYEGKKRYSEYVTMPDGIKIAVTVNIPENLGPRTKIPTILHQTRYFREVEFRWPGQYLAGQPEKESIKRFTSAGYAYVNVDVRGSGASFGTRPYPWHKNEITDGAAIVDWIIAQPWSNGKVGTTGVSYAGTTAEFLLVNEHPAVKASIPRFALFDVYPDIVMPGGVYSEWFTKTWDKVNLALDSNRPGDALGFLTEKAVYGVMPVDADKDHQLLYEAVAGHKDNYRPHQLASQVTFRDERGDYEFNMDLFSPYRYMEQIDRSGAAVYSYSGWFDGAYSHSAIKRHMNLKNPKNKLVLGPWPHDGYWKLEPFSFTKRARFDQVGEAIRFFDYHLKGIDRGISTEAPVHYYTMGEEKWKAAKTWPPRNTNFVDYYFSGDNGLSTQEPTAGTFDSYKVNRMATTGEATRWVSLVNLKNTRIAYSDRKWQDKKLLCYDSKPIEKEMEVTGHPVVTIYVTSDKTDGQFFVYLEDIDPKGRVSYVTEGMLRAIHRKLNDEKPPYKMAVPYRTFKTGDALPLVPGEVAELKFDLLPVSYLFKKGHRIRIAIAGADRDNFVAPAGAPANLKFHRDEIHASKVTLPTIPRD